MPDKPKGKTGLILGASSGVGRALATQLAKEYTILAVSRQIPPIEGVEVFQCDIREYAAVEALFHSLAPRQLDFIVNCVGVGFYAPLDGNYTAYWENILRTNLLGLTNILSNLLLFPELCAHFIQVGSMATHRPSLTPGNFMYTVSKTAALPLLEHFRTCIRERGLSIRVSLLSPGYIRDTNFGKNFFQACPEACVDLFSSVPSLLPEHVAHALRYIIEAGSGIEVRDLLLYPAHNQQ